MWRGLVRDDSSISHIRSVRIYTRCITILQLDSLVLFFEDTVPDHQQIDLTAHETSKRILWCANDRFTPYIEAGVHQHWAARQFFEPRDQGMVARICFRVHRLHSGGIIDVGHRWNIRSRDVQLVYPKERILGLSHLPSMRFGDVCDQEHVRTVDIEVEPVCDILTQHRWRERTKALSVFDL